MEPSGPFRSCVVVEIISRCCCSRRLRSRISRTHRTNNSPLCAAPPWRGADTERSKASPFLAISSVVHTAPAGRWWNDMDKSINVLIVDDYRSMLRIIQNLLKQLEFNNVDEAMDGEQALAKLRAGNFGLVLSDWNMAPMTGLDLLKEVRADGRLKSLPFIMVTAESKTENVLAAKRAGVSNYIMKPFNAETLRDKIAKVLVHA